MKLQDFVVQYSTMANTELADWLIAECKKQNLAWSDASRRAGVAPNTISEIINGSKPGIKRLNALADFFGVSREYMLRLAGHLPQLNEPTKISERNRQKAYRLIDLWHEIEKLDPSVLDEFLDAIHGQAELIRALTQKQSQQEDHHNTIAAHTADG